MRRHNRHARLAPRIDAEAFHHVVRAENLVSARLDPAFGLRIDSEGLLDLAFAKDEKIVLVPFLLMQAVMLIMRENSPFIWPASIPPLRASVAREIEGLLEPWIKSLMLGRFANDECFVLFGDNADARELAARARSLGFLGAAPTDGVLRSIAPYVYAQRFGTGKSVDVVDAGGASGAAILARSARTISANLLDAQLHDDARRWFDLDIFGERRDEGVDVSIGSRARAADAPIRIVVDDDARDGEAGAVVATPTPPAVMVSFDPGDGAPMRQLAISAPVALVRTSTIPAVAVVGGSSGRIGLVVRSDSPGNDDADSDAAIALAFRLAEQGFAARVVPANHLRPSEYDLLHVFGLRAATDVDAALRNLASHPPLVVTPYADDALRESMWGPSIVSSTLASAVDETQRKVYLEAIRERRLESPGSPKRGEGCLDAKSAIARAGAVVASSPEEERRLRDELGARESRFVPGVLAPEPEAADVGAIVGSDDFVLVHAPMEARCNQHAIVRAAAELGYPLVLVGSVQDYGYYGEVAAALGDRGVWLASDQVTPKQLAGLYGRCRVFADASWAAGGLYRLLRAGARGAALVAPSSGYARGVWPGLVQIVDPASMQNVREGLRDAWQRADELGPAIAARTIEIADPFKSLVGVLACYQAAAQAVSLQS